MSASASRRGIGGAPTPKLESSLREQPARDLSRTLLVSRFTQLIALVFSLSAFLLLSGCDRSGKGPDQKVAQASENSEGSNVQEKAPVGGASAPVPEGKHTGEVALLAGGCFWGMEEILREIPGVLDTDVGYTGGASSAPTYEDVKQGTTGHAESVRVHFDPERLSYAELLEKWFFRMHDPTTVNRQGNDQGTQYRSAIFYTTKEQKRIAQQVKQRVDQSGQWSGKVVTEIVEATAFTAAEDYHQDYLEKHPGGYTCHYLRDPVY